MNFLAHALVAERTGPTSPRHTLGAALSDLCSMAGLRFAFDRLPDDVAAGVRCHWAADRVFHADGDFLEGASSIRAAALAAGLPPGASRALGHAGWELLLDGTPTVAIAASGFVVALGESPSVNGALAPGEARSWERLIDRLASDRLWIRYDDPAFVAERLFGMLGRRPRLAFPRDALAATTTVLATARPMVLARAEAVVERVVKGVRAGQSPTRT